MLINLEAHRKNILPAECTFSLIIYLLIGSSKNSYIFMALDILCFFLMIGLIIDYKKYSSLIRIKIVSLVAMTALLATVVITTSLQQYLNKYDFKNYILNENKIMLLFYCSIVVFLVCIVAKKVNDVLIMRFQFESKKKYIKTLLVGVLEVLVIVMVFMRFNYKAGDLKIGEINTPNRITITKYNNDNEKIVNSFGQMNTNITLFNRAVPLADSDEIKEIIYILSHKKCKFIDGLIKFKLYEPNLLLPSYDINVNREDFIENNNISFNGMKILGDKTIIFESSDILGNDGQIIKKGNSIREYAVELSEEERDKIINIIIKSRSAL